ncbi:hypothetical protein SLE2022_229120 [Rubroshorea leprosula]
MSSDLYDFGGSYCSHSPSDMGLSDSTDLHFYTDACFSPPYDSPVDDTILQAISSINYQNPVEESHPLDQFSSNLVSSSPPSTQLENISLYQTTQMQSLSNGYGDFGEFNCLEVKNEECQVGFDCGGYTQSFDPHSYDGVENVERYMQRSFSSNSFEGKPGFSFQPRFDSLLESPNFQSSPENSFFAGQMRRVYSAGDLQNIRKAQSPHTTQRSFSNPLATESPCMEESNLKVGRYSAEERKERISKYRAKRNQRNFNKTIKYACRKTLADNRPRIRGRFARNDEAGEIPKAACSIRDEEDEEIWFDGSHEEEDRRGGAFGSNYAQPQFQYYGSSFY